MRIRLRGWRAWLVVAAAGVAVAYLAWATREVPVPEIPRPGPAAFTEREVQMDVSGAARRVELEPRSAAAWGEYGIVLRAYRQHPEADRCFQVAADLADHPPAARQALLLRSEICRRQGRTSYADYLAGRAADAPEGIWPDPLADPVRTRDLSRGGRLDEAARLLRAGQPVEAERLL